MYYTSTTGDEKMIEIPIAETETHIVDCDSSKALRWRTVYLPEKLLSIISIQNLQNKQYQNKIFSKIIGLTKKLKITL